MKKILIGIFAISTLAFAQGENTEEKVLRINLNGSVTTLKNEEVDQFIQLRNSSQKEYENLNFDLEEVNLKIRRVMAQEEVNLEELKELTNQKGDILGMIEYLKYENSHNVSEYLKGISEK